MSAILEQMLSGDSENNEQQEQLKKLAKRYLLLLGLYQDQIEQILVIKGMVSQICRIVGLEVLRKLDNRTPIRSLSRDGVVLPIRKPIGGSTKNESSRALNKAILSLEDISTYPGLKEFFQKEINKLEELPSRPWQQRMDIIITIWNNLHSNASIYKYAKNKEHGNGALWKEAYGIDSAESFQEKFSVIFPDWLKARKKGIKSQETTQVPVLPLSSGSIFSGINLSGDALRAHQNFGSGRTHRMSDISPIPNDPSIDSDDVGETVPRGMPKKDRSREVAIPDKSVIDMPKPEKLIILNEALSFLDPLFTQALKKYAKGKTLPWRPQEFAGFPETSSGLLEVQFGKKSISLTLKSCPPNEGVLWNAFSTKDFVGIMRRNQNVSYSESDRAYKITTENGILIRLQLPPLFSISKPENTHSSETNTDLMNRLKTQLEESLDSYLSWYYKKHREQLSGIDPKEFLAGRLPTQFRGRQEGQSFTSEIFLLSGADFGISLRQSLLEALHDFPEIQEFFSQRPVEGLSVNAIRGDKKGIYFLIEASGGSSKVVFHPYKQ